MTKKLGRNDPCHCGSGKKYKKCCLDKDVQIQRQNSDASTNPSAQLMTPTIDCSDVDDLDDLSNRVVDLVNDGKLQEAESACDELDQRFPDMIDCLERRAMLLEARGEAKLAADYYRRAAQYAQTHEGFDPETVDDYLDSAKRLDTLS
jgi:tetratricopeptide (TPR) repeat protein